MGAFAAWLRLVLVALVSALGDSGGCLPLLFCLCAFADGMPFVPLVWGRTGNKRKEKATGNKWAGWVVNGENLAFTSSSVAVCLLLDAGAIL